MEQTIADRHGKRRLGGGESDTAEPTTDICEQLAEIVAKRLGSDSDGEGNKYDEHRIFGGGGATLVTAKATDQIRHFKFLLQEAGPVASGRQRRSQSPLSQCQD
jgi:hypothetical protein